MKIRDVKLMLDYYNARETADVETLKAFNEAFINIILGSSTVREDIAWFLHEWKPGDVVNYRKINNAEDFLKYLRAYRSLL